MAHSHLVRYAVNFITRYLILKNSYRQIIITQISNAMEINKEAILNKTHYGLNIYAYVIGQYYPKTVLSLKGRDCGVTRNPFNGGKTTLQINIVDNVARHYDTELGEFKGDIFDFASYHFKIIEEQELLNKLNETLHLRIGQKS